MRLHLGIAAAAALTLTGCPSTQTVRETVIIPCPPEPVELYRRDGEEVVCPDPDDVLEGLVRDAYVGYLSCRALFHAQNNATAECIKAAQETAP